MTSRRIKWLSLILAAVMTLSFSGCSKGTGDDSSSESSDVSGSEDDKIKEHKIGYIFRESAETDSFASQLLEQSIRASNRSGMDICYIENVSLTDFENAVKKLSDAGCTDIVACSPAYANLVQSVAQKYLDLSFTSFGDLNGGFNISGYAELPYQGAYVAGFAAEFNSPAKKIGVVVDPGLYGAVATVNAVELGAQLNPDGGATVYAAAAELDGEIENAVDALLEKGCDVIVCYTNSKHSADYCEAKGVKFIGCLDYSDSESEYSNMLMYFYCLRDSYFLAQFKAMKMGTWELSTYLGDISNGIVQISPVTESVAKDGTQKLTDALVPHLTDGSAKVFKGPLKDTAGNVKYLETDTMTDREVENMSWYVQGVEVIGNFREPQTNIPPNDLEIKE